MAEESTRHGGGLRAMQDGLLRARSGTRVCVALIVDAY
jgi:hypothetical protein